MYKFGSPQRVKMLVVLALHSCEHHPKPQLQHTSPTLEIAFTVAVQFSMLPGFTPVFLLQYCNQREYNHRWYCGIPVVAENSATVLGKFVLNNFTLYLRLLSTAYASERDEACDDGLKKGIKYNITSQ